MADALAADLPSAVASSAGGLTPFLESRWALGDLFKAASAAFARFVFAWLVPSLISLGLFTLLVLPNVPNTWSARWLVGPPGVSGLTAGLIFSFLVLTLSVLLAYASLPIYRVLEGYNIPRPLRVALIKRHRRRFLRLKALESRFKTTGVLPPGLNIDKLREYPDELASVRATRLGNALTAMESWSRNRYHLDSQTMWFELLGVSADNVRRDTEESRAPVDFFVSAIANASLLAASSWLVSIYTKSPRAAVIGLLAAFTIPVSYQLAVTNMLDWTQSVKAMVNLSRRDLAHKLGLSMPEKLEDEQRMWSAHYYAIELNHAQHLASYNFYRLPSVPPPEPPT